MERAPSTGPHAEAKTSTKALASLVFSFFSIPVLPAILALAIVALVGRREWSGDLVIVPVLLCPPLAAIAAVVLGHWSRAEIKRGTRNPNRSRVALAGLILGYCGIGLFFVDVVFVLPNLIDYRYQREEASAAGSLRWLNNALAEYAKTFHRGYPSKLAALGPHTTVGSPGDASAAELIDAPLASGRKSGYIFDYVPGPLDTQGVVRSYEIHADPIAYDIPNQKHFFTDETVVIRVEKGKAAQKNSPSIEP